MFFQIKNNRVTSGHMRLARCCFTYIHLNHKHVFIHEEKLTHIKYGSYSDKLKELETTLQMLVQPKDHEIKVKSRFSNCKTAIFE